MTVICRSGSRSLFEGAFLLSAVCKIKISSATLSWSVVMPETSRAAYRACASCGVGIASMCRVPHQGPVSRDRAQGSPIQARAPYFVVDPPSPKVDAFTACEKLVFSSLHRVNANSLKNDSCMRVMHFRSSEKLDERLHTFNLSAASRGTLIDCSNLIRQGATSLLVKVVVSKERKSQALFRHCRSCQGRSRAYVIRQCVYTVKVSTQSQKESGHSCLLL
jgi:hypothetical protein